MTDIATLGVAIETAGGVSNLDNLSAAAQRAGKAAVDLAANNRDFAAAMAATGNDMQKAGALLLAHADAAGTAASATTGLASATVQLTTGLQTANRMALADYKAGLTNAGAAVADLGAAHAAASPKIQGLSKDVRESIVIFDELARGNSIGRIIGSLSILTQSLFNLTPANIAVIAGFGAVAFAIEQVIARGNAAEEEIRNYNLILQATGNTALGTGRDIQQFAADLAKTGPFSESDIQTAAAELLRFKDVASSAFTTVLPLAEQYAQATGVKLPQAVKILATAGEEGFKSLMKVADLFNVNLTPAERENLIVLDAHNQKFEEMMIVFGKVADALPSVGSATSDNAKAWKDLTNEVHGVEDELYSLLPRMSSVVGGIKSVQDAFDSSAASANKFLLSIEAVFSSSAFATSNVLKNIQGAQPNVDPLKDYMPPGTPLSPLALPMDQDAPQQIAPPQSAVNPTTAAIQKATDALNESYVKEAEKIAVTTASLKAQLAALTDVNGSHKLLEGQILAVTLAEKSRTEGVVVNTAAIQKLAAAQNGADLLKSEVALAQQGLLAKTAAAGFEEYAKQVDLNRDTYVHYDAEVTRAKEIQDAMSTHTLAAKQGIINQNYAINHQTDLMKEQFDVREAAIKQAAQEKTDRDAAIVAIGAEADATALWTSKLQDNINIQLASGGRGRKAPSAEGNILSATLSAQDQAMATGDLLAPDVVQKYRDVGQAAWDLGNAQRNNLTLGQDLSRTIVSGFENVLTKGMSVRQAFDDIAVGIENAMLKAVLFDQIERGINSLVNSATNSGATPPSTGTGSAIAGAGALGAGGLLAAGLGFGQGHGPGGVNTTEGGGLGGGATDVTSVPFFGGDTSTFIDPTAAFTGFGFASGGDFPGDEPIMVGEKGPEIIRPTRPGTVIPNDQLGQSTTELTSGSLKADVSSMMSGSQGPALRQAGMSASGGGSFGSPKMFGYASGGDFPAGQPMMVGEKGPELVTSHAGGSGGTTNHYYSVDARGADNPAAVEQAVQRALARQMPGIVKASVTATVSSRQRNPSLFNPS